MKFSGKMQIMIIFKVAKKQGFTMSLKILGKSHGRRVKLTPPTHTHTQHTHTQHTHTHTHTHTQNISKPNCRKAKDEHRYN